MKHVILIIHFMSGISVYVYDQEEVQKIKSEISYIKMKDSPNTKYLMTSKHYINFSRVECIEEDEMDVADSVSEDTCFESESGKEKSLEKCPKNIKEEKR